MFKPTSFLVILMILGQFSIVNGEEDTTYNVLFIVADDYRSELSCSDSAKVWTPHLDALASSGLSFDNAYCQLAICGPSRSSVLSGARPDSTGIYNNSGTIRTSRMPNLVTLPQLYKNHGYKSISIGKIYHHEEVETGGDVVNRPPNDQLSWSEEPWYHGSPYQQWYQPESFELEAKRKKETPSYPPNRFRGPPYEAASLPDEIYPDGQIASKAIQTLNRIKDETFFLGVGFRKPHLPFNCPQKYWDLYPKEGIRLPENIYPPENVPPMAMHDNYELRSYAGMPKTGPMAEIDAINLIRGYRACVSYMDAQIGRVLQELERLQLNEKTIVVFWSDHGYHLGENSLWTKMTNFEIAVRSPMIIRVPDQTTAGQKTKALVELVDIYPTLAELCHLPLPSHLEGSSFVPLLINSEKPWKTAVFSQYPRRGPNGKFSLGSDPMGYSMRTERYRFTEWKVRGNGVVGNELYDLHADPANNVNLATKSEYHKLVQILSAQLQAGWRDAVPK